MPGTITFLAIVNVSPALASVDRLILMDSDGKYLGGAKTPRNEWPIHTCVFQARPDVMSVAHKVAPSLGVKDLPEHRSD